MTSRITIVGASLAGSRTAKLLRRYGHEGPITLIGDEPHRPYDRPPLSKWLLAGDMQADELGLEGDDLYDTLELRLGRRAERLDVATGTVVLDDGTQVASDHVVLATGARPRRLPGQPDLEGIHLLRTVDDALALRDRVGEGTRVVVVGAGFIGMEVAATTRQAGADVTVVEFLDTPLVRGLGPRFGSAMADLHRERGVAFHLGRGVTGFVGDDRVEAVTLDDGTQLPADVVVVGIGVVPATDWLHGSGLTIDNGVVCDDHLRAEGGDGRVWAIGDVARWPSARFGQVLRVEHWTNAIEMAQVVARNLTGTDQVHDPVPYVWSDQYEFKVQIAGMPDDRDDVAVVAGSVEERRFLATTSRDGVLRGAIALQWPKALMRAKQLIEAGAGDRDLADLAAELAG